MPCSPAKARLLLKERKAIVKRRTPFTIQLTIATGEAKQPVTLGVDSGYVPYTAFSAKTSYMEKHPDVIQAFTDALQKGMEYVNTHTPEEIASVIQPQFSETDTDTITTIIRRYQEQDTWKTDLVFSEDSFELLLDILESAGQLEKRPDYKDVVTTEYAEKALQ